MGRILTIVAAAPQDGNNYAIDPAIEDVRAALTPFVSEIYRIRGASSTEELSMVLADEKQQFGHPELLQIIGHGRTGVLFLGAHWTKSMDGYGYLDSNPFGHGVLAKRVDKSTKVLLLGCNVGLVPAGAASEVADGPTLLFDLCRMWSCEVSAPDDFVMRGHFKDGVYNRPERLVKAKGLQVIVPPPPQDDLANWTGVGASRQ